MVFYEQGCKKLPVKPKALATFEDRKLKMIYTIHLQKNGNRIKLYSNVQLYIIFVGAIFQIYLTNTK